MYTFDSALVSDLHKDAFGHRPSADYMEMWFNGLTDEGRQAEWDYMIRAMKASIEEEAEEEKRAVNAFNERLNLWMELHAADERTALSFMTSQLDHNAQDIEHWVWQQGILFTDRGREIVKMVKQIYGVK